MSAVATSNSPAETFHDRGFGSRYVVGFLFSQFGVRVALIEKNRPAWQAGKLNAIGGKIEAGEEPATAMSREFAEEAGVLITDWRPFALLKWRDGEVHFFTAHGNHELQSKTSERVDWYRVDSIAVLNVIPNVRWLVPLALDKDSVTVIAEDRS